MEEVGDILDPGRNEMKPPPFVHLRYVQLEETNASGMCMVDVSFIAFQKNRTK